MKIAQFPQIPGRCEKLASCCFFFPWLFALTRVATCNVSKEQYSPISQNLFTSSSHVLLFLYSFSDCSTSQNFHYFFFSPWRLQTLLKYSLLRCAKAKRFFVPTTICHNWLFILDVMSACLYIYVCLIP